MMELLVVVAAAWVYDMVVEEDVYPDWLEVVGVEKH